MKTLEQYLLDASDVTTVHRLVMKPISTATAPDGTVTKTPVAFYIHPDTIAGDTLDFQVDGNSLTPDPRITRFGDEPADETPAVPEAQP